jgi:methionyl-tRNA formyltransferase
MSAKFKILFLGVKRIGTLSLEALLEGDAPLAGAVTMKSQENLPIIKLANDAGIPVFQNPPLNSSSFIKIVQELNPGRVLAFSYPRILKKNFLSLFEYGCINFHPARLPHYRGCFPTVWPILEGDREAYLTMHYMDEGIDTGDIIDTWKVPIGSKETGFSLYEKLIEVAPFLLKRHLPDIFMRHLAATPQDHSKARYFSKKLPNDGQVDWTWKAELITRFVRALYHPFYESAFTVVHGQKIEILEARVAKIIDGLRHKPKMFIPDSERLFVACNDGYIEIKKMKLQSGKVITKNLGIFFKDWIEKARKT